jgi:hypothetical protein
MKQQNRGSCLVLERGKSKFMIIKGCDSARQTEQGLRVARLSDSQLAAY